MQKLLFIVPPNISYDTFISPGLMEHSVDNGFEKYVYPVTDMPIGIISLSSYIKKYVEVETRLIDFNIILNTYKNFKDDSFIPMFIKYFKELIADNFIPDVIGISVLFSTSYSNMLIISNTLKELFPDTLIVGGGGIPTNLYKKIFSTPNNSFDALCYGEGEIPLLDLLIAEDKKKLFKEHLSWITKEKSENQNEYLNDLIYDLDEIPFYDYALLDLKSYQIKPTLQDYNNYRSSGHLFYYLTSRGCPYRCSFCASHTVHGRKMRYHSLERIKKDFFTLKEKFGATIINFQDDHLISDPERMKKIISFANEIGLQLYFQNGISLKALTREMLEVLKNTGVNNLVLPVESGSAKVLKEIMHKPVNLTITKQVVNDCKDLEIDTNVNILIGLPGETKQDINDTRIFLKTLDANWFHIMVATPLVGSEMHKICIEKNYIDKENIDGDFKNAVINTEEFNSEYIKEFAYYLNLELNFVENTDFKLGNYKNALEKFKSVIKIKDDHAFAYYYAAKCYGKLQLSDQYLFYKNKFLKIIDDSFFWKNYALEFNLQSL